jgi:outer membrane protein TolC
VSPSKETLPQLPPLPDTGVPGELVQRRPDVQQAWRLVQAADRDLAAAISNRFPRLSLEASVSDEAANAGELFDDWLVTLAGNLLLPVIDGGERRAAVTSAEAGLQERVQEYRQTVLVAIQEVEDALARERQLQERLASLERRIELSDASYQQLRRRYLNGAVSYTDVLGALRDQQDLQRTRLTARRQLLNYRVALYRALAGPIKPPAPESSTPTQRSEKDQA